MFCCVEYEAAWTAEIKWYGHVLHLKALLRLLCQNVCIIYKYNAVALGNADEYPVDHSVSCDV